MEYLNSFIIYTGFTLLIQCFITRRFTNSNKFSYRAFLRNLTLTNVVFSRSPTSVFLACFLEVLIEALKFHGYHFEKYIATIYQYNDYWREVVKQNPRLNQFSEGNYDQILGINTLDHSSENLAEVTRWLKAMYETPSTEPFPSIDGNMCNMNKIQTISYQAKFREIAETCKVKKGMRVLEIGFGECDFLTFLKTEYELSPIGVSISKEQVDLAKKLGFEAYEMDFWNMTTEQLGSFDVIIQCGNNEYVACSGENTYAIYVKYCTIVKSLLKEQGKYFVTCIHGNEDFGSFTFDDLFPSYILWSGNDGIYPFGKDGFVRPAESIGLKCTYQQEKTIDYFISSILMFSKMGAKKVNLKDLFFALLKTIAGPYFLHTYLCYTPTKYFYMHPWIWQFVPQWKKGKWRTPCTLQYLLFENNFISDH